MSCHATVTTRIPAPRLTRSDSDRSKTITSWPARWSSTAVAHPAIDPPMIPTLIPATPSSSRPPGTGAKVAGRGRRSAGDEGQVRVGAPLGQRAVVQPGVGASGQPEREQVDRRGDAAAAVGDDRLVRADTAAGQGGGA